MSSVYKTLENIIRGYVIKPLMAAGLVVVLSIGDRAYSKDKEYELKVSNEGKVLLSNAKGVEGGSFGLSYNPNVIKITDIKPSGILANLPFEYQLINEPSQSWTLDSELEMLEPRTGIGAAKDLQGRIYIPGGKNCCCLQACPPPQWEASLLRFDESNGWQFLAEMHQARADHAVAPDYLGRIYVIGGNYGPTGETLDSVERYDHEQNKWEILDPLPAPRMHPKAVSDIYGKNIYVIGGRTAEPTGTSTVFRYDVLNESWYEETPMIYPRLYHAAALGSDGKIYAIGGASTGGTVESFDPSTKQWTQLASLISHPQHVGSAIGDDCGFIYAIGGWNPGYTNEVERYDISKNIWESIPSLNVARNNFAPIIGNSGKLYVFGGDVNHATNSSVEYFSTGCEKLKPRPEYLQILLNPVLDECSSNVKAGIGVAWVNSLSRAIEIPPGNDQEIFSINWLPTEHAHAGNYSPIRFTDCLKSRDDAPPIDILLSVDGNDIIPYAKNGKIALKPFFRRGDSNDNGKINISDPINTIHYLFSDKSILCEDAADANDDGQIDISDIVYTLNKLFSTNIGVSQDRSFSLKCSMDLTPDALKCENDQQSCID